VKCADPPTNVAGVANGVHVDPLRYSSLAVPEPGTGLTVTVAPAALPDPIDALSAAPVTVGATTVIVNGAETVVPYTARYSNVCGGTHEKCAVPPTRATGVANGVHVDPFKYCRDADPELGAGLTVTVAPAAPPPGTDAASAVPVTVGGTAVTMNESETPHP
jgi:hypothetical protein